MWQYKTYANILVWDFVIKFILFLFLFFNYNIDLTCVKVYIREEFATVYLLVTAFDRTEVTVCGWKGVKTPLFTDILVEKCYDRVFMSCILLVETWLNQDCSSSPNNCQTNTVCVAVSQGKECSKYAVHDIQLLVWPRLTNDCSVPGIMYNVINVCFALELNTVNLCFIPDSAPSWKDTKRSKARMNASVLKQYPNT